MNRSPLLPIFLIVLVDVLGLTIILPLLPFYAEQLGASATVVGLLISSYALCQLVAGPILGNLSDHMGRKPLLIVSQIGTLIGFLILAFAQTLWLVFLSRVIDGLTAGNLSLAQAYIARCNHAGESREIVRCDRHRFRNRLPDWSGDLGFPGAIRVYWPIFAAALLSASSVVCTATLLPKAEPHTGSGRCWSPRAAARRLRVGSLCEIFRAA